MAFDGISHLTSDVNDDEDDTSNVPLSLKDEEIDEAASLISEMEKAGITFNMKIDSQGERWLGEIFECGCDYSKRVPIEHISGDAVAVALIMNGNFFLAEDDFCYRFHCARKDEALETLAGLKLVAETRKLKHKAEAVA